MRESRPGASHRTGAYSAITASSRSWTRAKLLRPAVRMAATRRGKFSGGTSKRKRWLLKPGVAFIPAPPRYAYQAASTSPCVSVPPKQGFLDKLKRHAEQTLERQAGKADAQIAKGTKGSVDAGVQDGTTAAVNEANQPCTPPAKGQGAK